MKIRLFVNHRLILVSAILFLIGFSPAASSLAAKTVVHAVLFYSPTCGHCHKVMTEDLPPLHQKYGDQLDILEVNATEEAGQALYRAAINKFQVTRDRLGVPALFVGNTLLVGSREIPEQFPGIIEAGLRRGGIDWPDIPGLQEYLKTYRPQEDEGPVFLQRFRRDPVANSIAVIVLIGMIASVVYSGIVFLKPSTASISNFPYEWAVPLLCLLGLGIAGYLSYVEIANTEAVCGPVGDCNTVQQSPFAKLWGILPVGLLGVIGYLAILAAWLIKRFGPSFITGYASLAIWSMAFLGTLFAAYLTFLEPFVIGATCAWCVGNAIVITLLMLTTTRQAITAVAQMGNEGE